MGDCLQIELLNVNLPGCLKFRIVRLLNGVKSYVMTTSDKELAERIVNDYNRAE